MPLAITYGRRIGHARVRKGCTTAQPLARKRTIDCRRLPGLRSQSAEIPES